MKNHQAQEVSDSEIDELKSLCAYFDARRIRAKARLDLEPGKRWHFALVGIKTKIACISLGGIGELRAVVDPPGEVELAGALADGSIFGAVGRYSRGITHELAIDAPDDARSSFPFTVAWWLISGIRIRSLAEFLVPVAADHSWSAIAGIGNHSCLARFIEDVPQARWLAPPVEVLESHVSWVVEHLTGFAGLLENPRFRLAVESLTTLQHFRNKRMMAASIWAGIEALLDVKSELRFRLALLTACILEPRGSARIECYRSTKKQYDARSKAVHGAGIADADLDAHVTESRILLSRMLCNFVERKRLPSENELEEDLLGA